MTDVFITEAEKEILEDIFSKEYDVLLFGSRVKGTQRKYSDLDICLKAGKQLPRSVLTHLRLALSDSDLPYTVDLIDFHAVNQNFRVLIESEAVLLAVANPKLS